MAQGAAQPGAVILDAWRLHCGRSGLPAPAAWWPGQWLLTTGSSSRSHRGQWPQVEISPGKCHASGYHWLTNSHGHGHLRGAGQAQRRESSLPGCPHPSRKIPSSSPTPGSLLLEMRRVWEAMARSTCGLPVEEIQTELLSSTWNCVRDLTERECPGDAGHPLLSGSSFACSKLRDGPLYTWFWHQWVIIEEQSQDNAHHRTAFSTLLKFLLLF